MTEHKNLLEILSDYAALKGKSFVWWNASAIRDLEAKTEVDKLNTVYSFYREFLPDQLYEEFFTSSFGAFFYDDAETAQDHAEDWFPPSSLCPDADHYVYCCVFNATGGLVWENVNPRQSESE